MSEGGMGEGGREGECEYVEAKTKQIMMHATKVQHAGQLQRACLKLTT